MVTVKAEAGGEMDTHDVTVMVTNVEELGRLSGDASVSYMENGTSTVATYMTDGPVDATWSLEGDDASDFNISSTGCSPSRARPTTRCRRTPTRTTPTW